MCEPVTSFIAANSTAISLAATAAGTAAQIQGQRQSQKAMNNAYALESQGQKGIQSEQQAIFDDSLAGQGAETQKGNIAAAEQSRQDAALAAQKQAPVVNIAPAGGVSKVVADETASSNATANAEARREAAAKALLSAFGDVQINNALQNTRARQNVGMLSDFSRGSTGVNSYEMDVASKRGQGMKKLGDILTTAGFVTGMAAGSGWGKPVSPSPTDFGVVWNAPSPTGPFSA